MPPEVIFREDFEDLERWDAWHFEGIERASHYEIVEVDGATVLSATADRSASGLILRESFAKLRWAATPD